MDHYRPPSRVHVQSGATLRYCWQYPFDSLFVRRSVRLMHNGHRGTGPRTAEVISRRKAPYHHIRMVGASRLADPADFTPPSIASDDSPTHPPVPANLDQRFDRTIHFTIDTVFDKAIR